MAVILWVGGPSRYVQCAPFITDTHSIFHPNGPDGVHRETTSRPSSRPGRTASGPSIGHARRRATCSVVNNRIASRMISAAPAARCNMPAGSISSSNPTIPGSRFRIRAALSSPLAAEATRTVVLLDEWPSCARSIFQQRTPAVGRVAKTTPPAIRWMVDDTVSGVPSGFVGNTAAVTRASAHTTNRARTAGPPMARAQPRASATAARASVPAVAANSGTPKCEVITKSLIVVRSADRPAGAFRCNSTIGGTDATVATRPADAEAPGAAIDPAVAVGTALGMLGEPPPT